MMKTVYKDFVSKAAAGRDKSFDEIDEIAQGRVWTGKQAKELGLVDEIGGLDTALSIAKKQAGFAEDDKVNLIVLPKQRPFFEQLLEQMIEDMEGSIQLEGWKIGRLEGWGFQPSLLPAFPSVLGAHWQQCCHMADPVWL